MSDACWIRYRRHVGAVTLTTSDDGYRVARRYFLHWYAGYLDEHAVRHSEVRAALRRAWWPDHHPRLAAVRHRVRVASARVVRRR